MANRMVPPHAALSCASAVEATGKHGSRQPTAHASEDKSDTAPVPTSLSWRSSPSASESVVINESAVQDGVEGTTAPSSIAGKARKSISDALGGEAAARRYNHKYSSRDIPDISSVAVSSEQTAAPATSDKVVLPISHQLVLSSEDMTRLDSETHSHHRCGGYGCKHVADDTQTAASGAVFGPLVPHLVDKPLAGPHLTSQGALVLTQGSGAAQAPLERGSTVSSMASAASRNPSPNSYIPPSILNGTSAIDSHGGLQAEDSSAGESRAPGGSITAGACICSIPSLRKASGS
jgi:hypothetical protein